MPKGRRLYWCMPDTILSWNGNYVCADYKLIRYALLGLIKKKDYFLHGEELEIQRIRTFGINCCLYKINIFYSAKGQIRTTYQKHKTHLLKPSQIVAS